MQNIKEGEGHVEWNGGRRVIIVRAQRGVSSCPSKRVEVGQGNSLDAVEPQNEQNDNATLATCHITSCSIPVQLMTNIIADKHAARGRGCGIPTQAQVYFYTSIYVVHCCSNLREREEFSSFFTCQVCNHHRSCSITPGETAIALFWYTVEVPTGILLWL